MKRTIRSLALPAAILLVAAGCSSSNDTAPGDGATAQEPTQSDTAPSDGGAADESDSWPIVEDEDGNVVENPEDQPLDDGATASDAEGVVDPGAWGTYSTVGMELPKGEGEIDVRVASVECEVASIPDAVENPVYMESGGEEGEPNIAAEAPEGKEFCIFSMEYKNVGATPYQVDEPGAVVLDDGTTHDQSTEDHDISWTIQDYVIDLNPGDEGEYQHIISVPSGAKPVALMYPQESAVLTSTMVFVLE